MYYCNYYKYNINPPFVKPHRKKNKKFLKNFDYYKIPPETGRPDLNSFHSNKCDNPWTDNLQVKMPESS
jgi:hypothetical protein